MIKGRWKKGRQGQKGPSTIRGNHIFLFFFFKIIFVYLRQNMRGGKFKGKADYPLSREPDAGFDSGTPGS